MNTINTATLFAEIPNIMNKEIFFRLFDIGVSALIVVLYICLVVLYIYAL